MWITGFPQFAAAEDTVRRIVHRYTSSRPARRRADLDDCESVSVDLMAGVVGHVVPSVRVLCQRSTRPGDSTPVLVGRRDRHSPSENGAHPQRRPKSMGQVDHPHGCTVANSTRPPDTGAGSHASGGGGGCSLQGRSMPPSSPCSQSHRQSGRCARSPQISETRNNPKGWCPRGCWCRREDSNFHGVSPTWPSTMRVYQFRHSDVAAGSIGTPAPNPAGKDCDHRPHGYVPTT